jgi:phage/plasmid-like protein (TIGR03299 family)
MAHGIMTNDAIAYNNVNGKPWHEIGYSNDGYMTAKEVIEHANLGWEVDKMPLQVPVLNDFGSSILEVPNNFAMVRRDTMEVLGVVGNQYTALQNVEAFDFFDNIVDAGEAIYDVAGSLYNGRKVFIVAKMPDYIQVGQDDRDVVEKYVVLHNTHDGTSPVVAMITPIRVVCNNTLTWALKDSRTRQIRIRHSRNVGTRVAEASMLLGITNKIYTQLDDIFNQMSGVKMNTNQMNEYFLASLGKKALDQVSTKTQNMVDDIFRMVEEGYGVDYKGVRGSLWGAYNAVTEYVDHGKNYKSDTPKMEAVLYGSGATIKENAFSEALKLVA